MSGGRRADGVAAGPGEGTSTSEATSGDAPVLEVRDLAFAYERGRRVFEGVSFALGRGDVLCVLGANGAGKSTLLGCLSRVLRPDEGQVLLEGRPLASLRAGEVAKLVGVVPQVQERPFGYAVEDYMVMGRTPYIPVGRQPSAADYAVVDRVIERLGIERLARRPLATLSGGERQIATIGRVLVQNARLIMLDEPTNHLDFGNQFRILQLIVELAEEGRAVLMTTHLPDHALLIGGRVGILDAEGRMSCGPADEMVTRERMEGLYGIDARVADVPAFDRRVCSYGRLRGGQGGEPVRGGGRPRAAGAGEGAEAVENSAGPGEEAVEGSATPGAEEGTPDA